MTATATGWFGTHDSTGKCSINSTTFQITNAGTPLAGTYQINNTDSRVYFVPNAPLFEPVIRQIEATREPSWFSKDSTSSISRFPITLPKPSAHCLNAADTYKVMRLLLCRHRLAERSAPASASRPAQGGQPR